MEWLCFVFTTGTRWEYGEIAVCHLFLCMNSGRARDYMTLARDRAGSKQA